MKGVSVGGFYIMEKKTLHLVVFSSTLFITLDVEV